MKKLLKLFGLMSLMMGMTFFVSCGDDDDGGDDGNKKSNPKISLTKKITVNDNNNYEAVITVTCESPDELSNLTGILYDANGGTLREITKENMIITQNSVRNWNVTTLFAYEEAIKGIKYTATTKNGGNTTTSFEVNSEVVTGAKIKVKFYTGYAQDTVLYIPEGGSLDSVTWEYGWSSMEVGIKEGNKPQINDVICILASKDPNGEAYSLEEYQKMRQSNPAALPHRFMIYTYVTDENIMTGYNTRLNAAYLEKGFGDANNHAGNYPSFDWEIYTDGLDNGANSKFEVVDFDRLNMVISGKCTIEFFYYPEMGSYRPPKFCSKAKAVIEFNDLKLTPKVNPDWVDLYGMKLRQ